MLLCFFLFTSAAAAPTETFVHQGSNTVLVAQKASTTPSTPRRTTVRGYSRDPHLNSLVEQISAIHEVPAEVVNKSIEPHVAPGDREALARAIATEVGITAWSFVETIRGESLNFSHNGQSLIPRADGPNGREDSWGICQIHLPDHPEVTREQALNPEWCLRWSAKEFKEGRARQWTEYRKLYTQ